MDPRGRIFAALQPNANPSEEPTILPALTLYGPSGEAEWGVDGMWTAPEARRKRFGAAVMKEVVRDVGRNRRGRGRGCLVMLGAIEGNEEARAFYESVGMRPVGAGYGGERIFEMRVQVEGRESAVDEDGVLGWMQERFVSRLCPATGFFMSESRSSSTNIDYCPVPFNHTIAATKEATTTATTRSGGTNTPSIAMLVRVAKMPPAGVKPPYM